MAEEGVYDVVVIGAGIQGSATAYSLAKEGRRVLLLEQFPLPHSRGSSHGQSRIIRKAYEQEYYARMMTEAYARWRQLEREAATTVFVSCGLLMVGKAPCVGVENAIQALQGLGSRYEQMSGKEITQRFPELFFPDNFTGVFESDAGILKADLALRAYQSQFVANGGVLKDRSPVVGVRPGDIAHVTTTSATYRTRSVVITAGPWTDRLIKPLGLHPPLQPIAISVNYWRQLRTGYSLEEGSPNTIIHTEGTSSYSLPAYEYPGHVKVCLHTGPDIDPDKRDEISGETSGTGLLKRLIRNHYPGLEDKPSIVERCIYTMTPDEDFILDTHPVWKNIVIGAGFSGHGFKLAPVVGKILSELATGRTPSYDLTPFRMDRFLHSPPPAKL